MKLTSLRDVPLLRANYLFSQEKGKKGYKSIQPEINKMSEFFGSDFEKRLYKSLFDEIDFEELKPIQNCKNIKTQYFLQEFSVLLYRPNFISFFSEILMNTENTFSVKEIFDSLNKAIKMPYEQQMKILISFMLSNVERFVSDGKAIALSKIKDIQKEGKVDQLSQSTIQTLLLVLGSFDDSANDILSCLTTHQDDEDNMKQISDIEKLMEINIDDSVETEKILLELHPKSVLEMFNKEDEKNDLISFDLDEKRLANFILCLLKNQTWTDDKETQFLSKTFLETLGKEKKFDDSSSQGSEYSMDLDGFYSIYKNYIDGLDIKKIFSYFDDPSFSIKTKEKFEYFIEILQKFNILKNSNQLFEFMFTKWENEINQIEFIKFAINNPPSIYLNFKNYPNKKIKKAIEINPQIQKAPNSYLIEPWKCIELTEILLKLSSGNHYVKVKEIFDWPIQNIPEIIAYNLTSLHPEPDDFLFDEIIADVLNLFLSNHMNSFSVIEEVWMNDKNLVIRMICSMYNSQPDLMNLSRILDITQKLKDSLILLVDCDDYNFAVNLAILAVKRDFLHVENWLKERINNVGDEFIEALLNYISVNLISHCKENNSLKGNILEKSQLTLESLAVMFENLINAKSSNNPKISPRMESLIKEHYNQIFEIFDELHLQPANSEEIEQEANSIFQLMFRGEITVYDTIEKLKSYMTSPDAKKKEVYSCMVHCLLDEYRFFHQYPEKQLQTVAALFGLMIKNKLIDGMIETIALKYILEAIKKGSGLMFTFGTTALNQFVEKLPLYPTFLKSLREIKQLKNNNNLYKKIHEKIEGERMEDNLNQRIPVQGQSMLDGAFTPNQNTVLNFQLGSPTNNQMKMNPFPTNNANIQIPSNFTDYAKLGAMGNMNNMNNFSPPQSPINSLNSLSLDNTQQQTNPQSQNQNLNNPQMNMLKNNYGGNNTPSQQMMYNFMKGMESSEEEGKSFKGSFQQNPQMPMEGNNSMLNSSLNNSTNNPNNLSGISDKSPKRGKTKLSRPQPANTINITEMLGVEQEKIITPPPQEIIDNMKFIFNSMGKSNVPEKAKELKQILVSDNIIKWFSDFFIVNRVSVESNNHQSYNQLITIIDNKDLNNYLIKDTIHYIQKVLSADTLDKDLKQKNLLKNLGSWLGLMTLNRNRPILAKDLDFKEILIDAYKSGKLSPIVTFVSRVLEHTAKTKVFNGQNPWMQAILSMLCELNAHQNLKPNLTFEIENLFKKLDLDLTTYNKSKILEKLSYPLNSPDFVNNSPQSTPHRHNTSHHTNTSNISTKDKIDPSKMQELYFKIAHLDNYILEFLSLITTKAGNVFSRQELVHLLAQLLYSSIEQIINPVIERAVNISMQTTKELLIKDFIFERDVNKFKSAAYNCIKSLSGSLALVTCKEPLKIDFTNRLKETLIKKKNLKEEIVDEIIGFDHFDLLDIGFSNIYHHVIKKAVEKIQIDPQIVSEIEKREKGEKYDVNDENYLKVQKLPELLKPKEEGLTTLQLSIYDNYKKMHEYLSKFESADKTSYLKIMIKLLKETIETPGTNHGKMIKNYEVCMVNIQNISQDKDKENQKETEEFNELLKKLEQCILDYKGFQSKIAKDLGKVTFKFLMSSIKKNNTTLFNIYSALLKGWIKLDEQLINKEKIEFNKQEKERLEKERKEKERKDGSKGKSNDKSKSGQPEIHIDEPPREFNKPYLSEEITFYFFYMIDFKNKFNPSLHFQILQKEYLNMETYQKIIFFLLEKDETRDKCRELIKVLLEKIKFKNIFPFMSKKYLCGKYFTLFNRPGLLPSNLNTKKVYITDYSLCNIVDFDKYNYFREMCSFAYDKLAENIHTFQAKEYDIVYQKLNSFLTSPFITNNEQNIAFFMIITELCITKLFITEKDKKFDNYSPEDEAKSIYTILTVAPESVDKLRIFGNFLFGFFRTLNYDYIKSGKSFNQRPYYKLLISFLALLNKHKNNDIIFNGVYPKIAYMTNFCDFLRLLNPKNYPGFALSWLDLISSKYFACCFLEFEQNSKIKDNIRKYEKYLYLVIDLLNYITVLASESYTSYCTKYFLEKVYKYIFVLCNTFPEFISNYYFYLLMSIPSGDKFMQIKNLFLSCGPKEIEKPDPFVGENKGSQEKRKYAVILFDIANVLNEHGFRNLVNEYVDSKNTEIISAISNQLNQSKTRDSNNFIINAIVVYWSQKLLKHVTDKNMQPVNITNFYMLLMKNLDEENKDHLINAMLNELRFPSIQTLFFSDLIVYILREIKNEMVEEHIITNICERAVYKPIPWGLCRTFSIIMKNAAYKIKHTQYYANPKNAEMIEKIFESAKKEQLNNFI
ncbi:MAG: DUF3819 domain-containing protein [archaeon]|nr:DUF3819 domain-containing protein [archaeon]